MSQRAPEGLRRNYWAAAGSSAVIAGCRCELLLVLRERDGAEVFAASGVETGTKTSMEDSDGDLSVQREAFQSELYHNQIPAKNLVQHLRTLVALTDPEDGILQMALNSLDCWKT